MHKKVNLRLQYCLFFTIALLALWVEWRGGTPPMLVAILPLFVFLMFTQFKVLVNYDENDLHFLLSSKGVVIFIYLVVCGGLTCTPVDELLHRKDFFTIDPWFFVSLAGIICALSFLNYSIDHPNGKWICLLSGPKYIWQLSKGYFLTCAAFWVFILTNIFSYTVFEHIPHI